MMNFKLLAVCIAVITSTNAGFLNVGHNNPGSSVGSGNDAVGGNYGFQQQVPLTLTPGPIPQSASPPAPHSSAFAGPASSQASSSYNQGPTATSSSYHQQHVNSVPATITTHGVATSYVAVPVHGFFNGNAGVAGNAGGNNGGVAGNGGFSGNGGYLGNVAGGSPSNSGNAGSNSGSYGYGGYGYAFSAGGNTPSSNGNQGNNAGGYPYGFGGNGAASDNTGYSG